QPDGLGTGAFYYDENTQLEIASLQNNGGVALKGWLNGDGTIFADTGTAGQLTTYPYNAKSYLSKSVPALTRPGRVMWDYGDRIFEETVFIGNPVTFSTVDDPAIKSVLIMDQPPASVTINDAPQGSSSDDM